MPIFSNLTSLFSSPETAVTIIIARLLIATLILPFHDWHTAGGKQDG